MLRGIISSTSAAVTGLGRGVIGETVMVYGETIAWKSIARLKELQLFDLLVSKNWKEIHTIYKVARGQKYKKWFTSPRIRRLADEMNDTAYFLTLACANTSGDIPTTQKNMIRTLAPTEYDGSKMDMNSKILLAYLRLYRVGPHILRPLQID